MKHVIIGAGAAGIAAAATLRQSKADDEIVLISSDNDVHSRCMLHNYISGERTKGEIRFIGEDFFQENRIIWKKGINVLRIDTQAKVLRTSGGDESYDKLLIATGSESVIPPVGALRNAGNVYGLRHLADAEAIRERAQQAERIVIIGAGLVGLDAAYALLALGKKPVIVEMEKRVLPLNLDERSAAAYQKLFEDHGCIFRLGCKVKDTISTGTQISAISLEGGETLLCDMVIVAAGVRPAIPFLEGSGIEYSRAITVDERMRTSVADVYAAGDVTGLSGIWPNASEMGEVAAKNMTGQDAVYDDSFSLKNIVHFFGLATMSSGVLYPAEGDSVVIREIGKHYNKWILRDGVVQGVILQGDVSYSGFWQYLIKNRIKVKEPVWKASYADYFSVLESGEYTYAAS